MKYHTNLILGSAFVYIILSSFISQINWTFCIEWFAFLFYIFEAMMVKRENK